MGKQAWMVRVGNVVSPLVAEQSIGAATVKGRRGHQVTFAAAGAYNIAWGLYAVADPQWLFRVADMPRSNTPQIFACLGMVLGLYGLLYLEVARRPEHGWLPAAVGFVGKVLGPIGLAVLILRGTWPPATLILIVTNDIIWWVPFARYLRAGWPAYRATWT